MNHLCEWCQSTRINHSTGPVYWELPDGSSAIEITNTPTVNCLDCHMSYQTEAVVKLIEDQLLLINTRTLAKQISYQQLMELPRILKRNYFDFS